MNFDMQPLLVAEILRARYRRSIQLIVLSGLVVIGVGLAIASLLAVGGDMETVDFRSLAFLPGEPPGTSILGFFGYGLSWVAFLLGESAQRLDRESGLLQTLATWTRSRSILLASRMIGGGLIVGGATTVLCTLYVAAVYLFTVVTGGEPTLAREEVLLVIFAPLRAGLVTFVLYATGVATAAIVRSAALVITMYTAYSIAGERLLGFLIPGSGRFFPLGNASAFMDGAPLQRFDLISIGQPGASYYHGPWLALLIFAVEAAALVGVSLAVFSHTDL